jgi:DNA-binding SARP family transcriptional activator
MQVAAEQQYASVPLSLVLGAARREVPQLRLHLLGGFRVGRDATDVAAGAWQRRSAKALTKLLAATPGHALHREQVLEMLWPEVDLDSALNSFGKALHAARRALEPELLPRESSSYLQLNDSVVALDPEHVWVDADHFESLAEDALRRPTVSACEAALAAYGGALLPENRYDDWCTGPRECAEELHLRVLTALAEVHATRGKHREAAARLREVLQHDPAREDVHRRLMTLYVAAGARDQAVRQFHVCQDVLRRELDLAPAEETKALYERLLEESPTADRAPEPARFVGRRAELAQLGEQLTRADDGNGRLILLHGETGVGKSRLAAEFATEASRRGCCVLSAGSGDHTGHLAYGPFAVALEGYVARLPARERSKLARRYPALARFVPSLGLAEQRAAAERSGDDQLYLVPAIVGLLTEVAQSKSVVLVFGDLHGLHRSSLDLLGYLAALAAARRWLIVGTYRDEALEVGSDLERMVAAIRREGLALDLELERLSRADCDRLVRALLPARPVSEALLDHVYARSLGNPLFAEELLRECPGLPAPRLPSKMCAQLASRLGPMDVNLRRVLTLAAAHGKEISLADLRAGAAALRPPVVDAALFDALDRALDLRIVEEREGGYEFRHPLVRSALYESLSTHRRDELHTALRRSRADRR